MTTTRPSPSGSTPAEPSSSAATRGLSKQATKRVLQTQSRIATKSKGQRRIVAIVEQVSASRGVAWRDLFALDRSTAPVSSARVLAMALSTELGVPLFIVARAFSRDWATVYYAESRCSTLYQEDATFRKEWDTLIKSCSETEN